jgi:hypothetical protein
LGKGGALETLRGLDDPHPTAVFFAEQTVPSLQSAVTAFEQEAQRIDPAVCRQNAMRFTVGRFRSEFGNFVAERYQRFRQQIGGYSD